MYLFFYVYFRFGRRWYNMKWLFFILGCVSFSRITFASKLKFISTYLNLSQLPMNDVIYQLYINYEFYYLHLHLSWHKIHSKWQVSNCSKAISTNPLESYLYRSMFQTGEEEVLDATMWVIDRYYFMTTVVQYQCPGKIIN